MAAVKGQPSPKPTSVSSPVPSDQDEVEALFAETPAPSLPAQPQGQAQVDEVDALFADGGEATQAGPTPDQFAPEPGFVQANLDQFRPDNFITRLQAGLAANDTEKLGFLKKKYGDDNVTLRNDKIYYRKAEGEKFKRLDPETFELISDIIPDFAREIVMEGAMLPGELGGAALAGPAGATGGRVASVPFANSLADEVAKRAGVPRDESRSKMTEDIVGGAAEAVMPFVGRQVVRQTVGRIPGTLAYKAAREAGEKEVVALSKQSQDVLQAADELEREGIELGLTLNQVQPDSPKVQALAGKVGNNPQFLNKQMEFAEGYREALTNTLTEISRRANPGGKLPEGKVAETITNAVANLEKAEGRAIGEFRKKAIASLGNKKQPLPPELQKTIKGLMDEFGFTYRALDGKVTPIPPKDLRPLIGTKGLTKTGEVRSVINALTELGRTQNSGGARLTDLDRLVTSVGDLNPKLRGSAAGNAWGGLTGALRQHRRDVIGSGLADPTERALFNRVMDDYSSIKQGAEQLSSALRGDVTSRSIVNSFFKGKENLANIRALKSLTGPDSPEWGALKEEFINQLITKHSSDGPTGFNSKAFLNDLEKNYGSDFIREALNDGKAGPNYDTVKKLLTVGKRIEAVQKGIKPETANEQTRKGIVDLAIGLAADIKFKSINGLTALLGVRSGQEKALFEILNRDGFEKYLAGYRGKGDKADIARKFESMMMQYNAARSAKTRVNSVLDAGKDLTKRGTRSAVREDVMRRE